MFAGLRDDLSKLGSNVKLKSPPIMSWWESKFGNTEKKDLINCSSSTLGAYIFASVIGLL